MRGRLNLEIFEYIESKGKTGVTSREIASRFWMKKKYARTFLSKYTNYRRDDGTVRHYLIYNPPPAGSVRGGKDRVLGTYTMGTDWWGELRYGRAESC